MASSKGRLADNTSATTESWYGGLHRFQLERHCAPASGTSVITIGVLPDNSVPDMVRIRTDTAITATTANQFCIGFTSNLDALVQIAISNVDAVGDSRICWAPAAGFSTGAIGVTMEGGDAIKMRGSGGVQFPGIETNRTVILRTTNSGVTASGRITAGDFTVSVEGYYVAPIQKLSN